MGDIKTGLTAKTDGRNMVGHLYYGDNLEVLRNKIQSATVDLCYIDPPFNSKRNYFQIYNNIGKEDPALAEAFVDTWEYEARAATALDEILTNSGGRFTNQLVALVKGLEDVLGKGSLLAYILSMSLRITEIHRALKATGSFYLHCDPTASHYLKLVLDAIFVANGGLFQNEIIWRRTGHHSPRRSFGPVHDVILFYTKARAGYTFNIVRRPYMKGHVTTRYTMQTDGRYKFTSGGNVMTGKGWTEGASGKIWRRFNPKPKDRHWAIPSFYDDAMPPEYQTLDSISKLDALYTAGLVEDDGTSEWPIMARYLTERDGTALPDIWAYQPYTEGSVYNKKEGIDDDVKWMGPTDPDRLGYPTQKPEGLLDTIIGSSSNEGDTILDAYCACGTTIAVAQRLRRNWIGMDITYQSISLMLRRIEKAYGKGVADAVVVGGIPKDMKSAQALAHKADDRLRKEFEKWAVLTYTINRAVINDRKGADKGIDGTAYFKTGKRDNAKIVFQVKSGCVERGDIAKLSGDMKREKAVMAVFLTLEKPTKPMLDEAKDAGQYEHEEMGRKYPVISIVTIKEIVEGGERLQIPMSLEVLADAKLAASAQQFSLL